MTEERTNPIFRQVPILLSGDKGTQTILVNMDHVVAIGPKDDKADTGFLVTVDSATNGEWTIVNYKRFMDTLEAWLS